MTEKTYHGKLVQKQEGIYSKYVFQLDDSSYLMCTKLPNWGIYELSLNTEGFITVVDVEAGEIYFDRNIQAPRYYNYSNCYFKEFIKDQINNTEKIIL